MLTHNCHLTYLTYNAVKTVIRMNLNTSSFYSRLEQMQNINKEVIKPQYMSQKREEMFSFRHPLKMEATSLSRFPVRSRDLYTSLFHLIYRN